MGPETLSVYETPVTSWFVFILVLVFL
jgi:hypothetical protein